MFKIAVADTPELKEAAHRARYQFFCVENDIIDPALNTNGLERDPYDDHAEQGVLMHRDTNSVVGTVRIILPDSRSTSGHLPINKFCYDERLQDPDFLPADRTAEFSRFALMKQFRARIGDGLYGRAYTQAELDSDFRRVIPHISLGLMTVALQIGVKHGIEYVCAGMEPALLRMLQRFGIQFQRLGPMCDYHGWRQPCYAKVSDLLEGIEAERPDIWNLITEEGRLWKAAPPARRRASVGEMAFI